MTIALADPELTAFLTDLNARPAPPAAEVGASALRAGAQQRARAKPRGQEMAVVRDLTVGPGGRPARLYRATSADSALILYLHGGGWVFGDLDTHDRACRRLAARSRAAVLALDYRLAPEHPWPAAVDDAVAALQWIRSGPAELQLSPTAIAVAGDSAGGTTAALACVRLRDHAPEALPRAQLLLYPNTDLGPGSSLSEKAHGFGLDVGDIEWFNAQWVPDPALRRDPRVSPLFEPTLVGLPRTVIITCEHDPLRDQGEAYAERLRQAGVPITARREPGMLHNFVLWENISPACAAATDRAADDLMAALAAPGSARR